MTPKISWTTAAMTAANTTRDGTSGTTYTVYTCGGASGSNAINLRFTSRGNNPQTVARIWVNNGSTAGTAANNHLLQEVTLPQVDASELAAIPPIDVPLNIGYFPNGYVLFVTLGNGGSAGWNAVVIAPDL